MTLNETELQAQQIIREQEQNSIEYKKFKDDLKTQEAKSDGSNTPYARQWKKHIIDRILYGIRQEIANPEWNRNGEATRAVSNCLNVALTYKVDKKTKEKIIEEQPAKSYFDLEVAVFVTLQLMLDNAMCPEMEHRIIDKVTGRENICYPAVNQDKLFTKVGKRVELNVAFEYVKECFPKYFQMIDEYSTGGKDGMAKSSSHYWRYNMERALRKKAEQLRLEGKDDEANRFAWKPFGSDARHVGSWLVTRCIKYGYIHKTGVEPYALFQQVTRQLGPKERKTFVTLTEQAFKAKQEFPEHHRDYIKSDMPMLCPPASADSSYFGHWLLGQNLATPADHKGHLRISQLTLDYMNRLQNVPYKINPFILAVMQALDRANIGLGKFQPHNYVEPTSVSQSLGLTGYYEDNTEVMKTIDPQKVKEAKWAVSATINLEVGKCQRGRQSKLILRNAVELSNHPQFYYPVQWDFRSRGYVRCYTSPQPQGSDYSKAAIKFAIEQPLDHHSKFYMMVEIANNAGQDKVSFGERVEWVSKNLEKIKLVSTMLEPTGDFTTAVAYLDRLSEPFQFLAAAEEFYHCFILKDRNTTSLRCGVDMSCSAAGIHSAWKLDKDAATAVNVVPGSKPNDLYLDVWNALLEANKSQSPNPIRPELLQLWTDKGYGRKVAKKMIMVYQYSAGLPKQMQEFKNIQDDDKFPEELKMTQDEVTAMYKLWPKATSKVMSVKSVIDWFQQRVIELHKLGKKEVLIPNATGSVQVMRYPLFEIRRIKSFHNGQMTFRIETGEADLKGWKRAILANATHMTDGAILALALHNFDCSFSSVHDAAYCYANGSMSEMLGRLKKGFVDATSFNIWDEFRKINGLDHTDPTTDFPTCNTLKLSEVLDSDYLFA